MTDWQTASGPSPVEQRSFSGKVGHIVRRTPSEWVALFDGTVLGVVATAAEARSLVEAEAQVRRPVERLARRLA